jgi:hypothetical protein
MKTRAQQNPIIPPQSLTREEHMHLLWRGFTHAVSTFKKEMTDQLRPVSDLQLKDEARSLFAANNRLARLSAFDAEMDDERCAQMKILEEELREQRGLELRDFCPKT